MDVSDFVKIPDLLQATPARKKQLESESKQLEGITGQAVSPSLVVLPRDDLNITLNGSSSEIESIDQHDSVSIDDGTEFFRPSASSVNDLDPLVAMVTKNVEPRGLFVVSGLGGEER